MKEFPTFKDNDFVRDNVKIYLDLDNRTSFLDELRNDVDVSQTRLKFYLYFFLLLLVVAHRIHCYMRRFRIHIRAIFSFCEDLLQLLSWLINMIAISLLYLLRRNKNCYY